MHILPRQKVVQQTIQFLSIDTFRCKNLPHRQMANSIGHTRINRKIVMDVFELKIQKNTYNWLAHPWSAMPIGGKTWAIKFKFRVGSSMAFFQIICAPASSGALNRRSRRMPQFKSESEWEICKNSENTFDDTLSNFTTKTAFIPNRTPNRCEPSGCCCCLCNNSYGSVKNRLFCGENVEVCRWLWLSCKNFIQYSVKRKTLFDSCMWVRECASVFLRVTPRIFCN